MASTDGVFGALESYERWRARRISIVRGELLERGRRFVASPWSFARGGYFRFADHYARLGESFTGAPRVLAAGDLHVQNVGTWRDRVGRLVWGVVDLDEVDLLPWPADLVRLASTALLAAEAGWLAVEPAGACVAILDGWAERIRARRPEPFVLGPVHATLHGLVAPALVDPITFAARIEALEPHERALPKPVARMLAQITPPGDPAPRILCGPGRADTLGARRLVVASRIDGGLLAREAVQVPGPVSQWHRPARPQVAGLAAAVDAGRGSAAEAARRQSRKWVVRALDPALVRVPGPVPASASLVLLRALGAEAANLHLISVEGAAPRKLVRRDADERPPWWLLEAAEAVAAMTRADHAALVDLGGEDASAVAALLGAGPGDPEGREDVGGISGHGAR